MWLHCRCAGNLNLEGFSVDACVLSGSKCGQAAADAFCQYLGFDKNAPGLYSTAPAAGPALSMTGKRFLHGFKDISIFLASFRACGSSNLTFLKGCTMQPIITELLYLHCM